MTRHPGSVEFDHHPRHQKPEPFEPYEEKADRQRDPGDRTVEPVAEISPVEGIGMDKQETPQIEDEWGGAPHRERDRKKDSEAA